MGLVISFPGQYSENRSAEEIYQTGANLMNGTEEVEKDACQARGCFERAIQMSHVPAMFKLAVLLEEGAEGVERDAPRAREYYEKAIDKGHVGAMFNLAILLRDGAEGVERDAPRAREYYEKAIDKGHVGAMFNLANLLEKGAEGVERDAPRAREFYEKAIDKGHVGAMFNLAILLRDGAEGVERDAPRAREYYEKAIDKGHVRAMNNLAILLEEGAEGVERDAPRAREYYEKAIDKGHVGAMFNLAILLRDGAEGVERDAPRAREYYEKAIDKGHVGAMFNLAILLRDGAEGVERDAPRAREYYEKAIDKGHVRAMNNLAILLEEGAEGVERDAPRAREFYEKAIDKGHVGAMFNLAILLRDGAEGVERDAPRAREYYEKAIDKGHVGAMNNLAILLRDGAEGVERDAPRAREYYEKAIDKGHVRAMNNLAILLRDGAEGVERDAPRAREYYEKAIDKGSVVAPLGLSAMLRGGDEGVPKDVEKAIFVLQNAVDLRSRAVDIYFLAVLLLAWDIGSLRNPVKARALLQTAVELGFPPAMHELAALLDHGDVGVGRNVDKAQELFRSAKQEAASLNALDWGISNTEWEKVRMVAGDSYREVVERMLRNEKVRSKQCSLLVIGGAGRGKTSVVRSFRGLPFVKTHDTTELVQLSQLCLKPGQRGISEESMSEVLFNVESLIGNSTRLRNRLRFAIAEERAPMVSNLTIGEHARHSAADSNVTESNDCGEETISIMSDKHQLDGERKHPAICSDMKKVSSIGLDALSSDPSGTLEKENPDKSSVKAEAGTIQDMTQLGSQCYEFVIRRTRNALSSWSFPTYGTTSLLHCFDAAGQLPYMMTQSIFLGSAEILLVVVNLQNLQKIDSESEVAGEINTACRWIEIAFSRSPDPSKTLLIIAGTRKESCGDVNVAWNTLFEGLKINLGRKAYDTWILGDVIHIAIENSQAVEKPGASGLEELESAVKELSEKIVQRREPVAIRWIALVEELEKVEKLFLTRDGIMSFVHGFQLFGSDKKIAEADAMKALAYYHQVGRVFMFQLSEKEVYLFPRPSTIIDLFRQVAGPDEHVERRLQKRRWLKKQDALMIRKGLLSVDGLRELWSEYTTKEQDVMLNLLCRFDLLMQLQRHDGGSSEKQNLIAIPALLPKGMKGFDWGLSESQSELRTLTRFEDGFPSEMVGSLISFLHRTIGGGQTAAGFLGFDTALLTVKIQFEDTARALVCMDKNSKRLQWTVRAAKGKVIDVTRKCIRGLEQFLERPSFRMGVERSHFLLLDCKESGNGCGDKGGVEVEASRDWVNGTSGTGIGNMEAECGKCEKPWKVSELLKGMRDVAGTSALRMVYDVFISHAGSEKQLLAIPMKRLLEKNGLRCFLDEDEMGMSQRDVGQQLDYALCTSRIVIFIITAEFVSRKWPMKELRRVLKLWEEAQERAEKGTSIFPIIFPLFYSLSVAECKDEQLPIGQKYVDVFRENGFFQGPRQEECSLQQAMEALKSLTHFAGLRNDLGESAEVFLARVGEHVKKKYGKEFGGGNE